MSAAPLPVIAVVGSLNQDLVARVVEAPGPGVTVTGADLLRFPGGKGLNQAGAAGRLGRGCVTFMIGKVGEDELGASLRRSLAAAGVNVDHVLVTPQRPTGVAIIVLEANGQNRIVVTPGANDALLPADVERAFDALPRPPALLLLQLETPVVTVEAAAARAARLGATVVLDPAPAQGTPREGLFRHVDVLTPNEGEALALLGEPPRDIATGEAFDVARRLVARTGARTVMLKLGARGAYVHEDGFHAHVPAPVVQALDTTAAGDTWSGALATMLVERHVASLSGEARARGLIEAVTFANCAAAIAVTREGALSSVPYRHEVELLVRNHLETST